MTEWIEVLMRGIEVGGIAIITLGVIFATAQFATTVRQAPFEEVYARCRRRLGQAILLGLELLVAADIIGTVAMTPTLQSVAVLGLIVLVRRRMSREPERVSTSDALTLIRKYAQDGVQILGVDGFLVAPEGFYASLDLLLDVSGRNLTVAQAAAESEAFVKSKARPDVVWEVWARAS